MSPCIPLRLSNRSYFIAHLSIKAKSMEAAVHLCYEQISRAVVTQHWLGCNWCLAKACQSTSQRRTPSSDRSDRHIKSLYTLTGFLPRFGHRLMTASHYLHGLHTGRSKSEHTPHTIQPQQTCQQQVNDRLNSRASIFTKSMKGTLNSKSDLAAQACLSLFPFLFQKEDKKQQIQPTRKVYFYMHVECKFVSMCNSLVKHQGASDEFNFIMATSLSSDIFFSNNQKLLLF